MGQYKEIRETEALEHVWASSRQRPVLLFKHSTQCPISAGALEEFRDYLDGADEHIEAYLVKVIEDRPVSDKIEEMTGVNHESPQIFLLKDEDVRWHTSHSKITTESIGEALRSVTEL